MRHHKNNFTKEICSMLGKTRDRGLYQNKGSYTDFIGGLLLNSSFQFKIQNSNWTQIAVKEQGRGDEIVTSATPLSTRRRERGTFLPTVRYVVTVWVGYFTPLPWFPSGWSIVALLWMAQCFLFHGLDRWHSSPIAYIQHPREHDQQICVDWLASAVVSTPRTNVASILTMVYANNLFCEDRLTHY